MATIGFIGLGNMGGPMAVNLVKAGHTVCGFDIVEANMQKAAEQGMKAAASSTEVADGAECIITMLPAGQHLLAVYEEVIPAATKGTLFVDCSTVDVASARKAHEMATASGMLSLDSPVSGGVGGAEAGTLTLMAGGSQEAYDKSKPFLEPVSQKVVHCGDAGAGQAAKICNNMLLAISMIGTCEAFVLAEKLGLSHEALFDVSSTSSGQCWSLTTYCPVPGPVPTSPANNGYKPRFAADLMVKDLTLAQAAAQSAGATTDLGKHALELYEKFVASGGGNIDFSGIINAIRDRS